MTAGYTVLIGGPFGVGSRIVGSIPRHLSAAERTRLRATLDAGQAIEVRCEDRAAWLAMAPGLIRQIAGVAP
jgi:hypothetical protein